MTSDAREVVIHYRAKGLTGSALTRAIRRHVRLLSVLDLEIALELYSMPLGQKEERCHTNST